MYTSKIAITLKAFDSGANQDLHLADNNFGVISSRYKSTRVTEVTGSVYFVFRILWPAQLKVSFFMAGGTGPFG